jgi:hypothetical protein
MKNVTVVIGAGAIGQAIARRVSAGKHVLLADLRQENADAPSSTRVLPHGAPHRAIHELRRTVHRGLRRAPRAAGRVLEIPERAAIRRPREARASAHHDCQSVDAAAPLHRRRRCGCHCGAEDRRSQDADRRQPGPLDIARFRLGFRHEEMRTHTDSHRAKCVRILCRVRFATPGQLRVRTTALPPVVLGLRGLRPPARTSGRVLQHAQFARAGPLRSGTYDFGSTLASVTSLSKPGSRL